MRRRSLLAGAGAFGAAMIAQPLMAEPGAPILIHAPLRLRFDNGDFETVDGFQITGPAGTWGRLWTGDLRAWGEDRIDLGDGGGLLRRPFRARWAEAVPIGPVVRLGSRLVVRAPVGHFGGLRVTVGARTASWDLPRSLDPMPRWSGSASEASTGAGSRVGSARIDGNGNVLVAVNALPAV